MRMNATPLPLFNLMRENHPRFKGFVVDGYDHAAFQSAFNKAIAAGGGNIYVGDGVHDISGNIDLDLSALSSLNSGARINLIGTGSANCLIRQTANNSSLVNIFGPSTWNGGQGLRFHMEGMSLQGQSPSPAHARKGIVVNDAIDTSFRDLHVIEFNQAMEMTDTVVSNFDNCTFSFNNYGLRTYGNGSNSPPNEMSFKGVHFTGNRQYGAHFHRSTNISMLGGSFEGNGNPGAWDSDPDRWDLRMEECGWNGSHVLGLFGTHFESSSGKAALWIQHGTPMAIYNIMADFTRNGSSYHTNEILFETTGVSNAVVNIDSAFWGVNGYTPSAARRYIGLGTVSGSKHRINYLRSVFDTTTEMPSFGDGSLIPPSNSVSRIGTTGNRWQLLFADAIYMGGAEQSIQTGTGSPEGVYPANAGSLYLRSDGSAGARMYFKTGAGFTTTGWVALTSP